jgi:hypothetical protein
MTAGYYRMVAQLDHAIGAFTRWRRGLADDTLVIVTTDHGEFLGEHQMIFKGPFGYDSCSECRCCCAVPASRPVTSSPTRSARSIRADDARRAGSAFPTGWRAARCSTVRAKWVLSEERLQHRRVATDAHAHDRRYKLHRYLEAPMASCTGSRKIRASS